jgi:hypothetical protein
VGVASGGALNVPAAYKLKPCYPNPFNPAATLTFTLPKAGDVSLIVYNISGEEVARLADGWHTAGVYRTRFDAGNLSSGVYIARLTAGYYQFTQRMLLLK